MAVKLTKAHVAFLNALTGTNLSAPTGNPPVMTLAKAGLIRFVYRSEELSVMAITPAGRQALQEQT
jgi:hypothetical protein